MYVAATSFEANAADGLFQQPADLENEVKMVRIAGVRFKKACKVYDFEAGTLEVSPGDAVIVEVEKGLGMGIVVYSPREVDEAALARQLKKIVRKADPVDIERQGFNTEREIEAFRICKDRIIKYNLPMKLIRVEYLFDSSKAIFYFTSDMRVDFRELVKDLAATFHTRIEMRQIGVRDEAKMIGGLGPCGRNLALNPVKISGICGRLMCCLSYEHDFYQNERKKERENRDKDKDNKDEKDKGPERPPRGGGDRGRRPPGKAAGGNNQKHGCGGCGKHEPSKHEPSKHEPSKLKPEETKETEETKEEARPAGTTENA